MWCPERILARRSRTIVFDSPGTGQSETPLLLRFRSAALARIVTSLLDALGHRPSTSSVFGLLGGAPLPSSSQRTPHAGFGGSPLPVNLCGWGATAGEPEPLRRLAAHGRACWIWVRAAAVGPGSRTSLPWLGSIVRPTLLLAGTDDVLVPPTNAVQLARALPAMRVFSWGRAPFRMPRAQAQRPWRTTSRPTAFGIVHGLDDRSTRDGAIFWRSLLTLLLRGIVRKTKSHHRKESICRRRRTSRCSRRRSRR